MTELRCAAAIAASLLLVAPACAAEDLIHVTYSERPPYMMAQADGSPAGLTGTPAAAAFKNAGIAVKWHNVPTNRQLMMVKDAQAMSCAVGWFWTKDREEYAKFTRPIYRDRVWMVLANTDFAARGYTALDELTRNHAIRIIVKDNYSYGNLDTVIARWQPVVAASTASTAKMVRSISKGVVDLMFVSEDEGNYIMSHHPAEQTANLRLLRLKDMPSGPERHIMCGKSVPDDLIARLNKVIPAK